MFKFKNKEDKWYKLLEKKYLKVEIEDPYDSLFDYYETIVYAPYIKETKCKGHFYEIYLADTDGSLEELDNNLKIVLPPNLYDNFKDAVAEYKKRMEGEDYNNLDFEDELKLIDAFKMYDDYANANYKDMEDILKNCDAEVAKLANKYSKKDLY